MRLGSFTAVLLLASSASLSAFADRVVLKDGESVEGIVKDEGDSVVVVLDFGSVTFEKSQIARIEKTKTPLEEFFDRRAKIKDTNLSGLVQLARWANDQGLTSQARSLCREIVAFSPDHAEARKFLGQKKHEGKWLTEDEYMKATGYVRYRGRWVTQEVMAEIEAERRADLEQHRQNQLLQAELALTQAELARAEQEADYLRAKKEEAEVNAMRTQSYGIVPWWYYAQVLQGQGGHKSRHVHQHPVQPFGFGVTLQSADKRSRLQINVPGVERKR